MHFIEEETYEVSMPRYLNESIENYLDRILDDMKSLENQFLSCYIYNIRHEKNIIQCTLRDTHSDEIKNFIKNRYSTIEFIML